MHAYVLKMHMHEQLHAQSRRWPYAFAMAIYMAMGQ